MTTTRRQLLQAGLASAILPTVVTAAASGVSTATARNKTARPYRIFMILYRGETEVEKGFRAYLESRAIPVELVIRDVGQDIGKVPGLIAEARALRADLVYTWGTPVTLAVAGKRRDVDTTKNITEIPLVFTMVASPETSGLVESRTSSGRNITGASHVVPLGQQLGAIRAYRPLKSLAVIYNPAEPNSRLNVEELRAASTRERFPLFEQAVPLDDKGQAVVAALPQLIEGIAKRGPQLLYLGPDSFIGANCKLITETALQFHLPCFSATEIALRNGKALFGLVSRYEAVGRLTARMAEQILVKKMRPQDIPIETLARFSYLVNMSVAASLDAYPPLKVINYAEMIG
ncbi:MAG: ABC transporter substrate-binding protein [Pseudomonadota bacterium]